MEILERDEYERRFREFVQEADSIESLRRCQRELAERIARLCVEKARCIHEGDTVEVTEGPLAGTSGRVVARGCHTADTLLVELDGLELDLPLPIPAAALRVLIAAAIA